MRSAETVLLKPTAAIRDAIQTIDNGTIQAALVVDEEQRLIGMVTDGDIRRAILASVSLDAPVSQIMNTNPVTADVINGRSTIMAMMEEGQRITRVPVLDSQGRVVGIQIAEDLLHNEFKDHWVVLMAGGLGTRLRPLTETVPKPMIEVCGKPIMEIILERFIKMGFSNFYISVNYKAHVIKSHFQDGLKWGANIRYLEEKDRLGTAGALRLIPEAPTNPLIVMNGDLLTNLNFEHLLRYHQDHNCMATMCLRSYSVEVPYGVVHIEDHRLVGLQEKPTHDHFINAGIYVLNPEALQLIPSEGYFDMTSLFGIMMESGDTTSVFPLREYWIDVGRHEDLERARTEYAETFGELGLSA